MAKGDKTKHRRRRRGGMNGVTEPKDSRQILAELKGMTETVEPENKKEELKAKINELEKSMPSTEANVLKTVNSTAANNAPMNKNSYTTMMQQQQGLEEAAQKPLVGGGIPEAIDQYLGLKGGQRLGWSIEGELPSEIAFGGSRRRRYKRGKRGRRTGKRGGDALSDLLKKSGGVT